MNKIISFLKDVKIEMAKVSWPTKKELIVYSLAVIGISVFLTALLGSLDLGFQKLLNIFLLK